MARFLFTMWDGGGSIPPELGVARKLVARGHQVRVLADPTCEAEVLAAGCDFSPWRTAPHRTSRAREDDVLRDYQASSPLQMIDSFMKDFLAVPAPRWTADTLATLDEHPADVLVADFYLPGALIAAEARGVTSAVLVPNIWMVPTPGIPPLGPGWMPARGPIGRLRDWAMRTVVSHLMGRALPHLQKVRTAHGLPPVTSTHAQMLRAERVLVLSSPVFDFTSPAQPDHVRYTGAELDDPTWCAPWSLPWPEEDRRPLVAVGLSSTFQDQVSALRRIVEALQGMDVRGLVTLGEAIHPSEVPGTRDVVVVASAPHSEVFPRATVVITHCGHGTLMKALVAGKPVVCMPMGRDQNDSAARVVHAEAGLRIAPTASVATIRAAVQRALDDARLHAGAARLGRAIREREGCHDPVAVLEALLLPSRQPPKEESQRRSASSAAPTLGAT